MHIYTSILIAITYFLANTYSQTCENPVFIESVEARKYDHKKGFLEYRSDDLPILHYYLKQEVHTTWDHYYSDTGQPPDGTCASDFWYEGSVQTEFESDHYDATHTTTIDQCSGEETEAFAGEEVYNSEIKRIGEHSHPFCGDAGFESGHCTNETSQTTATYTFTTETNQGVIYVTGNSTYTTYFTDYPYPPGGATNVSVTTAETNELYNYISEISLSNGDEVIKSPTSKEAIDENGDKTTWELTLENKTGDFIECIRKNMPGYGLSWEQSRLTAGIDLNQAEDETIPNSGDAVKMKYRFKVQNTETEKDYRVRWREVKVVDGHAEVITREAVAEGTGPETKTQEFEVDVPNNHEEVRIFGIQAGPDTGCSSCKLASVNGLLPESLKQTPGTAEFENRGIFMKLSLGKAHFGRSAGEILISVNKRVTNIYAKQFIQLTAARGDVSAFEDSYGRLQVIQAPQCKVVFEEVAPRVLQIKYYRPEPEGELFKTWKIELTNAQEGYAHIITETDAYATNTYVYAFNDSPENFQSTLVYPNNLRKEIFKSVSQTGLGGNIYTTETYQVFSAAGGLDYQKTLVYKIDGLDTSEWRETLISETEGAGADARQTTYTYYDGLFPNGYGAMPVKTVTHYDGSWVYYQYDSLGRTLNEYRPGLNETFNEMETDKYILTENTYDSLDLELDENTVNAFHPRVVSVLYPNTTEPWNRFLVSRWRYIFSEDYRSEEQMINETDSLLTEYFYEGAGSENIWKIKYPDGTCYMQYYSTNGTDRVFLTKKGAPNQTGNDIVDGIQTELKIDSNGYPEYELTKDIASGIVKSRADYDNPDELGRPQHVVYLDGSSQTFTYGCCGALTTLDQNKVLTLTTVDALRRMSSEYKLGITTTNIYDSFNRIIHSYKYAGGLTSVITALSYNTGGVLVKETNALGGILAHYELAEPNSSGRWIKRTTNITTTAYRDEIFNRSGTLAEISGSAVTGHLRYLDGVETDNAVPELYGKQYSVEIRVSDTDGTNEWTRTYYDMAGRPYRKYLSGFPTAPYTYEYNSKGQLILECDPDGMCKLYEYNDLGEIESTGYDITNGGARNGTLDKGGTDRITSIVRDYYVNSYGYPVERERKYVWNTNGVSSSTLLSIKESSVYGSNVWQVIPNGTNNVTTQVLRTTADSNGRRSSKILNPDGSVDEEIFEYDRVIKKVKYLEDGTIVSQTTISYDPLGRPSAYTGVLNDTTFYKYNALDQPIEVASPAPSLGGLAHTNKVIYDQFGNTIGEIYPDGKSSTNLYYLNGLLHEASGARTYPVQYTYDSQGRMKTMTTKRGATGIDEVTTWNYDENSGLLESKLYDGSVQGTAYTYTPAGRLLTRQWARNYGGSRLATTYQYNEAGDVTSITYSDDTPDVTMAYGRGGRLMSVAQDGTVSFSYTSVGQLISETYANGTVGAREVKYSYSTNLLYRSGMFINGVPESQTTLEYDGASRLTNIVNGVYSVDFRYRTNINMPIEVTSRQNGNARLLVRREYDRLNRLVQITSTPQSAQQVPWGYGYDYNMANQRTRTHLWDGSFWAYNYDSYGQVISGKKSWRDDTRVAGQQFEYAFDAIGNRLEARRGGDGAGGGLHSAIYTANGLNQYTERTNPGYYDVIGLASSGASVNINGSSAGVERKGEYFRKELQVNNTSAQYPAVAVEASDGVNTGGPISGHLFVPPATESYTHDEDGNLAQDGRWDYTWDAENRLVKLESRSNAPGGSARRIEFGYDWRGRRVWRKVTNLGDSSVEERKYIYDGWNLYAEFDGNGALVQSYIWGPDLSGDAPSRQQRAGGVGGLVGVKPAGAAIHFVAYDGNGNVAGLVDGSTGAISAWYEYGPFGEPIRVSGAMAKLNPFRFSTKYTDDESGFLYYGYRYYNPETGRWLSRDPIGETGGLNLYGFVDNDPAGAFDPFGLDISAPYRQMQFCQDLKQVVDDSANAQVNDALAEYIKGGAKKISYGPKDPWTQALQQHSHLDGVRERIREQYKKRCEGSYGATQGQDSFNLNALSGIENAKLLLRDLVAPFLDVNMANTTGSIRFQWQQKGANNCCCRQVVISFTATDTLRLGSNTRIPKTTIELVSDNAFGPNGPLHNVDLEWKWNEVISY